MAADLFAVDQARTKMDRAKELLRAKTPDDEGMLLGCILYLSKAMDMPFSAAWNLIDDLVRDGFVSEANHHGQRRLLESGP